MSLSTHPDHHILCFGELLLRLSFQSDGAWLNDHALSVFPAGAEANVACALGKWQVPVSYFTALPDNVISHDLIKWLETKGMNTSSIKLQGDRMGVYYLPAGKDIKKGGVIYDRAGSSFAQLRIGTINWEEIFRGKTWLHVSAISPALNEDSAALCVEALRNASEAKIFISIDLNYRAALWKYGIAPTAIMPALVQYANLVMGNIWSANTLLGIPLDENRIARGRREDFIDHAIQTAKEIQVRFPNSTAIANTFRFDIGKGIKYYATLFEQGKLYVSGEYNRPDFIDKVGSGDCFMAGLIYGRCNQLSSQDALDFATAAAFLKLGQRGDTMDISADQIKSSIIPGNIHT